jgi:hypothetical protein
LFSLTWNSLVTRYKTKLDRLAEPMQKIKRVTSNNDPSTLRGGLGANIQREQKVRAVIAGFYLGTAEDYAYRGDFVCRKLQAVVRSEVIEGLYIRTPTEATQVHMITT